MKLRLKNAQQKSSSYYCGYVDLNALAEQLKDYPFEEETLEKARIHKRNMEGGISPFTVTLRLEPECRRWEEEGDLILESLESQVWDGKSRAAAVCMLEGPLPKDAVTMVKVFLATEEKMKKLEQNLL